MPYADPQVLKTYKQQWAEKNRSRVRENQRAWAAAHAEEIKAKRAAYHAQDHIKVYRAIDGKKRYLAMSVDLRKKRILHTAKFNAKKKGIEFNISVSDIAWPEICPVFGIKLNYGCPTHGKASWDSPSIDRHDHTKGYVKGNVVIMSWRANAIKRDATNEEVRLLSEYLNRTRSN